MTVLDYDSATCVQRSSSLLSFSSQRSHVMNVSYYTVLYVAHLSSFVCVVSLPLISLGMVKPAEPGPDGKTSPSSSSGYLTALSVEPDMVNIHASATTPSDPRSCLHQSALTSTTPYQAPREPAHPDSPALSHQQQENSLLTSGVADAAPFQPYRYQKHQSCQYETFLAYQRRRMPYSLGGELLMREEGVKEKLAFGEEQALSGDIEDLYQRLLPTEESDSRRKIFIQKIEALLKERWPMADIGVHVFGSSGNRLSTCDSDVDICITSSNDELETKICTIADLFAKSTC